MSDIADATVGAVRAKIGRLLEGLDASFLERREPAWYPLEEEVPARKMRKSSRAKKTQ